MDLFDLKRWAAISEALGLSPREVQILQGIFNDETDVAIADGLQISVHTVHTHCRRLYRKLDTTSRVGALVRVFREHQRLGL